MPFYQVQGGSPYKPGLFEQLVQLGVPQMIAQQLQMMEQRKQHAAAVDLEKERIGVSKQGLFVEAAKGFKEFINLPPHQRDKAALAYGKTLNKMDPKTFSEDVISGWTEAAGMGTIETIAERQGFIELNKDLLAGLDEKQRADAIAELHGLYGGYQESGDTAGVVKQLNEWSTKWAGRTLTAEDRALEHVIKKSGMTREEFFAFNRESAQEQLANVRADTAEKKSKANYYNQMLGAKYYGSRGDLAQAYAAGRGALTDIDTRLAAVDSNITQLVTRAEAEQMWTQLLAHPGMSLGDLEQARKLTPQEQTQLDDLFDQKRRLVLDRNTVIRDGEDYGFFQRGAYQMYDFNPSGEKGKRLVPLGADVPTDEVDPADIVAAKTGLQRGAQPGTLIAPEGGKAPAGANWSYIKSAGGTAMISFVGADGRKVTLPVKLSADGKTLTLIVPK